MRISKNKPSRRPINKITWPLTIFKNKTNKKNNSSPELSSQTNYKPIQTVRDKLTQNNYSKKGRGCDFLENKANPKSANHCSPFESFKLKLIILGANQKIKFFVFWLKKIKIKLICDCGLIFWSFFRTKILTLFDNSFERKYLLEWIEEKSSLKIMRKFEKDCAPTLSITVTEKL